MATAPAETTKRPPHIGIIAESGSLRICAEHGDGTQIPEGEPVRFEAKVYSGGAMSFWWNDTFVDLDTLTLPAGRSPVLRQHDPDRIAGYADTLEVREGEGGVRELWASGVLYDNDTGNEIKGLATQGHPWEFSIQIDVGGWKTIDEKVTETVNGQTITGPADIAIGSRYREVSFVTLGADAETQGSIAASHDNSGGKPMPKQTVKAEAVETDDITLEWLQEHKPDLVDEIKGMDEEPETEEETTTEEEETTGDEVAASLDFATALKAAGGDKSLAFDAMSEGLDERAIEFARQAAERATAKIEASRDAKGADPVDDGAGGGSPATIEASGDPAKDWDAHESIRAHWENRGGKAAFLQFARLQINGGGDYLDFDGTKNTEKGA